MVDPIRQFLDDPLSVLQRGVDNGQRVPVTETETSYALTIHVAVPRGPDGRPKRGVIGGITRLAENEARQVDDEFEINREGKGLPVDLVPQNLTSRTLSIARYELYKKPFSLVFGNRPINVLTDQTMPFSVRLTIKAPQSPSSIVSAFIKDPTSSMTVYEYYGCHFTDKGTTRDVKDIIVGVNATLKWTGVQPLLLGTSL